MFLAPQGWYFLTQGEALCYGVAMTLSPSPERVMYLSGSDMSFYPGFEGLHATFGY